jgi:hypothetical protein
VSFGQASVSWGWPESSGENVLTEDDTNKPPALVTALPLFRYAAMAVAAGRVALGVVALTLPSVPARPWVGASADELGVQMFARAMGARDLALGLGALAAIRKAPSGSRSESAWYAAGALSDALDLAITAAAWPGRQPSSWSNPPG